METPPPPSLSAGRPQTQQQPKIKPPERTAKTPFQFSHANQRGFKSELQPNRVSTRFHPDNNFIKSTNRFCPNSCKANLSSNAVLSRLNIFKKDAPSKVEVAKPSGLPTLTEVHRRQPLKPAPLPSTTPEPPPRITQLNLIQDTRAPNQQVGPVATITKAPLSVSQYTQPTPLPINKSAPQISRAYSEPSIKYQVQVNGKTYKVLRKIGSGGSAKVYEGFEPLTSQTVAIKIINVAKVDQRTQDSFFNEKAILHKLRDSKHVVHMYDSEYKADCKELIIVMEKGDADLSQIIDSYFKSKDRVIDGIFIKFYWRGMVRAVYDIHEHGIVHADLKPVNFILVKNEIKLIDFGIASAVDPGGTSVIRDYQIGTINYMAPESLRNRALDASFQHSFHNVDENNSRRRTVIKYNSKADIWSLGCILYNLVYGRPPFDKFKDIVGKVQAITDPRYIIDFPVISNLNLLHCMRSCLRYNPADRPSALELLNHPYLKEDIVVLQN